MAHGKDATSITFYCAIALKLRLDKAAEADHRSTSQYLCLLLDRVLPPLEENPQVDLEEMIQNQDVESQLQKAAVKRVRRIVAEAKKPKRAKGRAA